MTFNQLSWAVVTLLISAFCPVAEANPELPSAKLSDAQSKIYSITQMTENKKSCAKDGASVLSEQGSKFFVLKNVGDDRWGHYVYAVACKDRDSCEKALTANIGGDWIWMFSKTRSSTKFTGETTHTGLFSGEMCTDPKIDRITLEFTGPNEVTLSKKTTFGTDYPPEPMNPDTPPVCHTDKVQEMLKDKACDAYVVIRGVTEQSPK